MKKSLITISVLLLSLSGLSFAQDSGEVDLIETFTSYNFYDFDYTGSGARAKGMGNAFIGVSNDINGGGWNPAGLYEIDKLILGVSWSSLKPKGNSITQSPTDLTEINHSGSLNEITSFNFVAPIRISGHPFVGSVSMTRNFDVFNQMSFNTLIEHIRYTHAPLGIVYVDTVGADVSQDFQTTGGMNSINFGFGTRFYDKISFGVAANIYTGNSIFEFNQLSHLDSIRYGVQGQWAEADEFVTLRDTNKFSSINFTIGFKYNGDKLDAGLTIRTPFELSEKRQQAIFLVTKLNNLISDPRTDTTFYGDILYKYEMPMMLGVGFGYHMTENLLVAADFEYRPFSGKKVKYRVSQTINPGGSNLEEFIIIDPQWNNVFSIRVGSEYLKETSYGIIPIRFGLGYIPIPDPSVSLLGEMSTVVNYNVSGGTGIHWEQIKFDVAYSFTKADREFGLLNGEYNYKNHHLDFTFTGVF